MINILTWLWRQEGARIEYTTTHVNAWAKAIRRNTTVPHRISCVTDIPEGLDDDIHVITPPRDFEHFQVAHWAENKGLPQCYRRIAMFAPNAADIFGERFLCMDIDALILGNIDHLLTREEDFLIFRGTAATRPYNGGLIIMTAGARPQVYNEFTHANAVKASSLYVGSDQAWISHCLGRGEKTIGDSDGVTHYSPRFIRENGGLDNFKRPNNICMLFFPGGVKAFHSTPKLWKGTRDDVRIIAKLKGEPHARLLAYNDPKGWGREMQKHGFELIEDLRAVGEKDSVFVRLDQQGEQRNISRNMLLQAHERGCTTFPSLNDCVWYDDKVAQLEALRPYLPATFVPRCMDEAFLALDCLTYPFISKSAEGAGASNVRVINNEFEAKAEIDAVFGGHGIPLKYGRVQQDYLYWQALVPGNDCDYRIVVTGGYVHGLVRRNKRGTLFASGSGDNYPMTFAAERERIAAAFALEITRTIGTQWCALDIVFTPENEPKCLEISAAWTVKSYQPCSLFLADTMIETAGKGTDVFEIAAGIIAGREVYFEALKPYRVRVNGTTYGKRGDVIRLDDYRARILLKNQVVVPVEEAQA